MNPLETTCHWHTLKDLENETDNRAVVAMGLTMWANCMAGNTPPEYFGMWMVKAGERLGISPLPENFRAEAKKITA